MADPQFMDRLSEDVHHLQQSARKAEGGPDYDLSAVRDLAERMHIDGAYHDMPLISVCGKALGTLAEDPVHSTTMINRIIDSYLAMSRAMLVHNLAGKTMSASSELLTALNNITQSVVPTPAESRV